MGVQVLSIPLTNEDNPQVYMLYISVAPIVLLY